MRTGNRSLSTTFDTGHRRRPARPDRLCRPSTADRPGAAVRRAAMRWVGARGWAGPDRSARNSSAAEASTTSRSRPTAAAPRPDDGPRPRTRRPLVRGSSRASAGVLSRRRRVLAYRALAGAGARAVEGTPSGRGRGGADRGGPVPPGRRRCLRVATGDLRHHGPLRYPWRSSWPPRVPPGRRDRRERGWVRAGHRLQVRTRESSRYCREREVVAEGAVRGNPGRRGVRASRRGTAVALSLSVSYSGRTGFP